MNNVQVFENLSDVSEELDLVEKSLQNVHKDLQKLLHQNIIKENQISFYEALANKSKGQAIAAQKLKNKLNILNSECTIQFLDYKIDELQKKIENM